jgi:NAD(P)-dependent dehydrogenase (short-subunit alcohol dehydrogenase family)
MGKVAIVTGAGSGIGRATAQTLLNEGYKVALVGRREDPLKETAGDKSDALVIPADISDPESVDGIVSKTVEAFGRLDVLFNNAGMGSPARSIDETPVEDWLKVISINLTGSFLCARAAFAQMRSQSPQGGRIINNGSISAYVPRVGSSPYTSSKHAITGLTRSISLDGRAYNIACSQIDIGNALTPLAERMTQGVPQANGQTMVEPVMDVQHVANSVLHIANLPLEANVQFMTVMATTMPYIGRG